MPKMMKKVVTIAIPVLALALGTPGLAMADLLNGSFTNYTGGHGTPAAPSQISNSSTNGYSQVTNWTVGTGTYGFLMASGSGDTTGSYSPQFSNTFTLWGPNNGGVASNHLTASSPDGGNYLALDGDSGYNGTGVSQVLTGLTAGQQYSVNFYWAGAQQSGFTGATTDHMVVSFGSHQSLSTPTVSNVSEGFTGWMQQTLNFTADGTSDTLNFLAVGSPTNTNLPPFVLLDGVHVNAVPEPTTLVLMSVGLFGLGAARLRRRKAVAV